MTAFAPPSFQTERLTLRAPDLSDLGAYRAFYAASDMTEGSYRGGRTDEEVEAIHTRDIALWQTKHFGIWLLRRKDEIDVLGGAGFAQDEGWPCELTWWLMPDARQKGYASEACGPIIDYAYDTLGWDTVQTFMRDQNAPSHRLAQRLGGKVVDRQVFPDGITRDIYALPRRSCA